MDGNEGDKQQRIIPGIKRDISLSSVMKILTILSIVIPFVFYIINLLADLKATDRIIVHQVGYLKDEVAILKEEEHKRQEKSADSDSAMLRVDMRLRLLEGDAKKAYERMNRAEDQIGKRLDGIEKRLDRYD